MLASAMGVSGLLGLGFEFGEEHLRSGEDFLALRAVGEILRPPKWARQLSREAAVSASDSSSSGAAR